MFRHDPTITLQIANAGSEAAAAWLAEAAAFDNTTVIDPHHLNAATAICLNFPKFTDGRAYSQAALIRGRYAYGGAVIATGDVLVDQVLQMARCGFTHAILRADQSLAAAERQLGRFDGFYQPAAFTVTA